MEPSPPHPPPMDEECSYDLKIKFEPYYVEVHHDLDVVKLPRLFNKEHVKEISPKVLLCDPAGNVHQVAVEIRYSEAYFVQGWKAIASFYGLQMGGWARLVFVGSDMFLIHLRDRLDNAVTYPLPAKVLLLRQSARLVEYPRADMIATHHYADICRKPDLFHTMEKNLSHTDVTSGFFHIPIEFCQLAFRNTGQKVVVFDEYGLQVSCVVDFNPITPTLSGITEGWNKFCRTKWLCEGLHVELAVPVANSQLMSIVVMHV